MSAFPVRKVGLSRNQMTEPLLKDMIRPEVARRIKIPQPITWDAPPMASDTEDDPEPAESLDKEYGEGQRSAALNSILQSSVADGSDDSDTEWLARGDIKGTKFNSLRQNDGLPDHRTRNQAGKTHDRTTEKRSPDDSQPSLSKRQRFSNAPNENEGISSGALAEPDSSVPPNSSGSHLETDEGFIKRTKSRSTYGKRFSGSQEKRKAKVVGEFPLEFLPPPGNNSSPKRKSAKLLVPEDKIGTSPSKGDRAKGLNIRHRDDLDADDDLPSLSIAKPKRIAPKLLGSSAGPRRPKAKTNLLRRMERNLHVKKPELEGSSSPSSSATASLRAKLMIPAQFSDFKLRETPGDDGGEDEPFPDAASDSSTGALLSLGALFSDEADSDSGGEASCPWCGASVDKGFLGDFSKGKRLNVRMQAEFCLAHKKRTAMKTWQTRQYPQVEWAGLEGRFEKHRASLLGIINGDSSYYRTMLASKIELGQARLLRKEENLNPGYYGPRGFNVMCDYLVGEFGDMLREKAVDDRVIAGRGSAAFIQSVLVAELGVQLIKEDMGVSDESARSIMEESKSLGEMVHEET